MSYKPASKMRDLILNKDMKTPQDVSEFLMELEALQRKYGLRVVEQGERVTVANRDRDLPTKVNSVIYSMGGPNDALRELVDTVRDQVAHTGLRNSVQLQMDTTLYALQRMSTHLGRVMFFGVRQYKGLKVCDPTTHKPTIVGSEISKYDFAVIINPQAVERLRPGFTAQLHSDKFIYGNFAVLELTLR